MMNVKGPQKECHHRRRTSLQFQGACPISTETPTNEDKEVMAQQLGPHSWAVWDGVQGSMADLPMQVAQALAPHILPFIGNCACPQTTGNFQVVLCMPCIDIVGTASCKVAKPVSGKPLVNAVTEASAHGRPSIEPTCSQSWLEMP